jgi:molybdate transport system permease protein
VRRPQSPTTTAIAALAAVGALLVLLPLAGLLVRAPWSDAVRQLRSHDVGVALRLSLVTSLCATAGALLLGVPLAWVQSRTTVPGRRLLRAVTTLPLVLPPVVGGVALLLAFGRHGLVGSWLYDVLGIRLPFTTGGAVLAETFVALPFAVLVVDAGLRGADRRLEDAARSLGAGPGVVFWRVTLPAIRPALLAAATLCWARALGEFGATVTFAGSFPGRTQTLPLAVYVALERDPEAAIVLSLLLLAISVVVLVALRERWLVRA